MKMGAYDYITKPFLSEELIILIEKALEVQRLRRENELLRQRLDQRAGLGNIIGKSKVMREIYRLIEMVAVNDSSILIQGESGTGKELVAEALHHLSPRKQNPLVKLSCAALPDTLLESELFGHEKGAFTDAVKRKIGRFELADTGTIFLDDVDDIRPLMQIKLLRVLQQREFQRVGGIDTIRINVRVIAATKKDLFVATQNGEFREDLYYRLNVVPIRIPPLRERREDIPLLIQHFLQQFNQQMNKNIKLRPEVLQELTCYDWPGNVRELENLIERLVAVSEKNRIVKEHLPSCFVEEVTWSPGELKTVVRQSEREHIEKVLNLTQGRRKEAANILGITPKTLWQKTKEYGIS
jgi:DNA-binding NtrC family response regulator